MSGDSQLLYQKAKIWQNSDFCSVVNPKPKYFHGMSSITNCKNKILLFHALEYVDCIDWEKDAIHELPYTSNMSDEE